MMPTDWPVFAAESSALFFDFDGTLVPFGGGRDAGPWMATDLPDLSQSRAAIYAGDYERALALLMPLTATVRHADLYNLIGFANRKAAARA